MRRKLFKLRPWAQTLKAHYESMGLRDGEAVLVLGEPENMQGQLAVVAGNGRILWGLHPELFVEDPDWRG